MFERPRSFMSKEVWSCTYRISQPIRRTLFSWKMWPKFDLHLMRRG